MTLKPIDRVAARVIQKGEHYFPKDDDYGGNILAGPAPLLTNIPHSLMKKYKGLIGRKQGRIAVLGYLDMPNIKAGKYVVCRCQCGTYFLRKSQSFYSRSQYYYLQACSNCYSEMRSLGKLPEGYI